MHNLHAHFGGRELDQRIDQGFLGTLHIGLDDEREGLGAFGHAVEHRLELGRLLAGELDVAELALAKERDFARLALVGERHDFIAGSRNLGEALDFDRDGGAC